jgi:hypothetical protein
LEWKKNNVRNGFGKHILKNGDFFEGDWKDDQKDGRGTIRDANGRVKVGAWKKDKCRIQ